MNNLRIARELVRLARMIVAAGSSLSPAQNVMFDGAAGHDGLYKSLDNFLKSKGWHIRKPYAANWYDAIGSKGSTKFEVRVKIEKDTSFTPSSSIPAPLVSDKILDEVERYTFTKEEEYEYKINVKRGAPSSGTDEADIYLVGTKMSFTSNADKLGYYKSVTGQIDYRGPNGSIKAKVTSASLTLIDKDTVKNYPGAKSQYFDKIGIFWQDGTWREGTWPNGVWKKGTWEKGNWKGGIWEHGTWEDGVWEQGTWEDGTWNGGTWKHNTNSKWKGGEDKNGVWHEAGDYPNNKPGSTWPTP